MSVIELGTKINRGTRKTNFTYFRDVSCIKKTLQPILDKKRKKCSLIFLKSQPWNSHTTSSRASKSFSFTSEWPWELGKYKDLRIRKKSRSDNTDQEALIYRRFWCSCTEAKYLKMTINPFSPCSLYSGLESYLSVLIPQMLHSNRTLFFWLGLFPCHGSLILWSWYLNIFSK